MITAPITKDNSDRWYRHIRHCVIIAAVGFALNVAIIAAFLVANL